MPSPHRRAQLLLLVAIPLAAACGKKDVPGGDIAASLALPTTKDTTFDPATLKGKPTLVMFASPTCGYCIKELPIAQSAAAAEDANVVAVFVMGGKAQVDSVTRHAKFTAPVLLDTGGVLKKRYEIKAVPYMLVLGPDGEAHEVLRGAKDEAALRSAIASAR